MAATTCIERTLILCAALLFCAFSPAQAQVSLTPPAQPEQPVYGPAGYADYPHRAVMRTNVRIDELGDYVLYEPAEPSPGLAPVLVYLMGAFYSSTTIPPAEDMAIVYQDYLTHIARKGYIVIFPSWGPEQMPAGMTVNDFGDYIASLVKEALQRQQTRNVKPAHDGSGIQFALGGHSMGGMLALILAHQAQKQGLPNPRALLLTEGSSRETFQCSSTDPMSMCNLQIPAKFDNLPSTTKVLAVKSYEDEYAVYGVDPKTLSIGRTWCQAALRRDMPTIPNVNYSFLYIQRDTGGYPPVEASHLSVNSLPWSAIPRTLPPPFQPAVPSLDPMMDLIMYIYGDAARLDTTDWYGYWKTSVALLESTFKKRWSEYVFGSGFQMRDMGLWSNGKPVKPMMTASDYEGWFDITTPPPPAPVPPDAVYFDRYPRLNFGQLKTGATAAKFLMPVNFSSAPARVISVALAPGSVFTFKNGDPYEQWTNCAEHTLPAGWGTSCPFTIQFTPPAAGDYSGTIVLTYESNGKTKQVSRVITGTGVK